jgi:hypothetical protein
MLGTADAYEKMAETVSKTAGLSFSNGDKASGEHLK